MGQMNVLIFNQESFSLPGDGWYSGAPLGGIPHARAFFVRVTGAELLAEKTGYAITSGCEGECGMRG